jgi:hypothetical protein
LSFDLTIRQGDTTPAFTQTITDQNGNAVNLTSATVTFVMRQLSSSTPTVNAAMVITDATAGQVQYNWSTVDTATPGVYMAEIHCVLSGGGSYTYPNEGYLEIEVQENLSNPSQQLVTVANVKDVLNFANTNREHDTKILRWINAVRPVIENLVGPVILTQFEEWHDGGNSFIVLRRRPSTALGTTPYLVLNAISEYNGPIEWPLSIIASPDRGQLYSAQLDAQLGQVVRRTAGGGVQAFPYQPQAVHVTYVAGQSSVPDNVAEATLELIRQNYQHTAQAPRNARGSSSEPPEPPPMGFFVPGRVRELLGPNRRYPSIA